ncbi:site-specific integrase [Draconibacterium sp.]|nr:site-specific integrase [Draconibacterium sp.]
MKKSISFYVPKNRTDKRGLAPIYGAIRLNSKNYPFKIDKIKPRYWNSIKQCVNKNRENEPDNRHKEINELIENISSNIDRFDRFSSYLTAPPRDEVRQIFFQRKNNEKTFNLAYDEFIESNRGKVAYNTTRNRNTAKNFIKRYQEHIGIELQYSDISIEFFEKLYDYAFDIEELEDNTFAAYVAKFKAFLEWSINRKYYNSLEHKKYSFTEKDKPIICLTQEEFQSLYDFNFNNDRLDKARDLYCFGCLTGLRFSDIASLRNEHFQGDYIYKNIIKTKEEDGIPILPKARKIIDKYKDDSYYAFPQLSNVKLNAYIKECCEAANIKTLTKKLIYRKNQVFETFHPKHELITVHTARKTFITIAYAQGMDVKTIKSITGHKKDSTFDKYLKIVDEQKKQKMFEAWKTV